jgi:hypothetical protein
MVFPLIPLALSLAAEFGPGLVRRFAGDDAADVADKVIGAAKAVTGTDDPAEAVALARANPELAAKLRERLVELDIDLEKAYLADRHNARSRDVEMRKAGYSNSRADFMVAGAGLVLIACLLALTLLKQEITGEAVGIISTIAGIAGACLKDAFGFEFGSSRGSKEKDMLMRGPGGG